MEKAGDRDAELKVKTNGVNNVKRQVSISLFFVTLPPLLLAFSVSRLMKLPVIYNKCQRQAQQTAVLFLSEPSRAWGRKLCLSINASLLSSATTITTKLTGSPALQTQGQTWLSWRYYRMVGQKLKQTGIDTKPSRYHPVDSDPLFHIQIVKWEQCLVGACPVAQVTEATTPHPNTASSQATSTQV